jgi:DegV family protein with EDD domain
MAVKIVTDSTADLPAELARRWDITVIPATVQFGQESYRDGVDLKADEFFDKLKASAELPTTSQPSVNEFLNAYRGLMEKGDEIVSIHISENVSGTLGSARQAKELVRGEGYIEIIDSRHWSAAMALIVLEAAEAAKAGHGFDRVVATTRDAIARAGLVAIADTLEYASRGGRIGKAQYFLASILQIKPILEIREGELHPVERKRTRRRALQRLVELMDDRGPMDRVAIGHAASPEDAALLAQQLKPLVFHHDILTCTIGPVIGTHTGPGAIGIGFLRRG